MSEIHSTASGMDALREHLRGVVAGSHACDPALVAGHSVASILTVLRTLVTHETPYSIHLLNPLLQHLLEHDEAAYVEAVCTVFRGKTMARADNILYFLESLQGSGFAAAVNRGKPFYIMDILREWLKVQVPEPRRVVFAERIPDAEKAVLTEHHLLAETDAPSVSQLSITDHEDYYRTLRDLPSSRFPRVTWTASALLPDDGLRLTMSLLLHWIERKNRAQDAPSVDHRIDDVHPASSLTVIEDFYNLFRERYARHHRPRDLEWLNHIAWFVLTYLSGDADTGIFRPYANVNAASTRLLVDYLILNPKEHLLLFLMHNRETQYRSLSGYGLGFDGTEASGGSTSWSGLETELGEVPFAEHLLQPALRKLFEQHRQKGTLTEFWSMLKRDWLCSSEPTSSLCPTVLRRACVAVMLDLAAECSGRVRRDVFTALGTLVTSSEGIPATAAKVFSELRSRDALFAGRHRGSVRDLIELELSVTRNSVPRSCFTFECLLKLVKAKDKKSEALLLGLFANPDFYRRDSFEFDIIARIEKTCGMDALVMKAAVEAYQTSPEWRANASRYTQQTVQAYLRARTEVGPSQLAQMLCSPDADVRECAFGRLSEAAKSNFLGFTANVREMAGGRALRDAFPDRNFLVSATESLLDEARKAESVGPEDGRILAAVGLLRELVCDPDPTAGDDEDERVKKGESRDIIVGVRTRTCYAVARLACLRPFLPEAWRLTQRLMADQSAYVQYHAFVPMIEVLRRRAYDDTVRSESVALLWKLFAQEGMSASLRSRVLRAFTYVRDLNEADAERVLMRFVEDEGVEVLHVFYGVFRQDHVESMGQFDCGRFVAILEKAIDNGPGDLPLRILRVLQRVLSDEAQHTARVLPYLLRFSRRDGAVERAIEPGLRIVETLLKRTKAVSVADVRALLLNFAGMELRLLRNATQGSRTLWLGCLRTEALKDLYEKDREGFYQYLDLLADSVAAGKSLYLDEEMISILATEADPERLLRTQAFFDRLVACNPQYYQQRQGWIDRRTPPSQEGGT